MKKTQVTIKASQSSWLRKVTKVQGQNIALVEKLARVKSRRDYRVTYPFYCTDDMFEAFVAGMGDTESIGRLFNEFIARLQQTQEATDAVNAWKAANQA